MPPVVLPKAPLAPIALGAPENTPTSLVFCRAYEPLALSVGNCAAPTTAS